MLTFEKLLLLWLCGHFLPKHHKILTAPELVSILLAFVLFEMSELVFIY